MNECSDRAPSPRRIALTGATRGLGRALAERFDALGHTVLGCGRSPRALAELAMLGPRHRFVAVDVVRPEQVDRWAEAVLTDGGPPDLLINNAGLIHASAPLWEVPQKELSAVLGVNVLGVAAVMRAFLPAMIAAGRGVVVNFSSGWGRSTAPEVAGYCASKWAVEGLSRAVAQEVPGAVAVIPVNPGVIDTAMLRSCFGGSAGRYSQPARWAEGAAEFLLSLGPEHNGQPLTVAQ